MLCRDDDYGSGGKPSCDWNDPAARQGLVAELAADGYACLEVLEGRDLTEPVTQIAELLATVLGQDLDAGQDGRIRIARKVAKDRVISTVDPDTRHGHKTVAGEFQQRLDDEDIDSGCRAQPPSAPAGRFGKDRFDINLHDDTSPARTT